MDNPIRNLTRASQGPRSSLPPLRNARYPGCGLELGAGAYLAKRPRNSVVVLLWGKGSAGIGTPRKAHRFGHLIDQQARRRESRDHFGVVGFEHFDSMGFVFETTAENFRLYDGRPKLCGSEVWPMVLKIVARALLYQSAGLRTVRMSLASGKYWASSRQK